MGLVGDRRRVRGEGRFLTTVIPSERRRRESRDLPFSQHPPHPIHRPLQRGGLRRREGRGVLPQLELSVAVVELQGGEGHAAHRDAPRQRLVERGARGAPELDVEGAGGEPHPPLGGRVVGVAHREVEASRHVAALAEPAADPLAHGAEQPLQHGAVVGVGRQHVRDAALGPDRRRQHRAAIDAVRVLVQGAARASERDPERLFAERGDLADPLEVVVVEPFADRVGHVGQERHRFGRQEHRLVSRRHRPDQRARLALDDRRGRLAHQLVDRDPHRERQPEAFTRLALEAAGDVDG